MLVSDFDFELPDASIAQKSIEPRDHSKLMVVDRPHHTVQDKHFFDIVEYAKPGDVLVWNNSKVFKARLFGSLQSCVDGALWEHKRDIELFLVRPMENVGVWKVLAKPGKHVQNGMRIVFNEAKNNDGEPSFYCDVLLKESDGTLLVQFPDTDDIVREKANEYGRIPIPPYVKDEPEHIASYQTVYAQYEGSVAAPTAGFHFTPAIIDQLQAKGIEFAQVTLHVGLGTFLPVKSDRTEDHTMHAEWIDVSEKDADMINRAKKEGRRVIAVGTTTVRTLEALAVMTKESRIMPYNGDINIFITPGFSFQIVDALITNFHLPKSTLLMLVSAFVGDREFTLHCYKRAVENGYRFYSFGDAMFIHGQQ